MSYHARVINISAHPPAEPDNLDRAMGPYAVGHRDARHAAAEIAAEADAEIERLTEALDRKTAAHSDLAVTLGETQRERNRMYAECADLRVEVGNLTADLAAARAERDREPPVGLLAQALRACTAERDGLAKALRKLAELSLSVERVPRLVRTRSDALRVAARAALAALPTKEDDDAR